VSVCSDLIESLLDTMHQSGADFTNTFRCLSRLRLSQNMSESVADVKHYIMQQCATLEELQNAFAPRMDPQCVHTSVVCFDNYDNVAMDDCCGSDHVN